MAKETKKTKEEAKLPLKLRIKAWWEGYDEDEIAAKLKSKQPADGGEDGAAKKTSADNEAPVEVEEEVEEETGPWTTMRADVSQLIWGDGYCGPGGTQQIIGMTKLLALNKKMTMLEVGAGMGGPARVLAENFGVWVEGLEQAEKMVEIGNQLSEKEGMSKKVSIKPFHPEVFDHLERKYDRIFSKECFFQFTEKKLILSTLFENLKPEGLMLVTDYIIENEGTVGTEEYRQWRDGEYRRPYPVTKKEMETMLKNAGFVVRISEDITESYLQMVSSAWKGADKVIAGLVQEANGTKMIDTLLREAEFWSRRTKMMEQGHLKVWRFLGYRREEGAKMMSNW